jgi:hypothetical protein
MGPNLDKTNNNFITRRYLMINNSHKMKRNAMPIWEVLFLKELKLDFVRIRHKKTSDRWFFLFYYRVNNYFPLLASRMYFSKAIVIEGAFGDGA